MEQDLTIFFIQFEVWAEIFLHDIGKLFTTTKPSFFLIGIFCPYAKSLSWIKDSD